ncbi:MAG: hypothetical protein ACM3SR_10480 [Ignavibacteriales bacterium]
MRKRHNRILTSIHSDSIDKGSLVAGIDISKFSEILRIYIEHNIELEDFLNKIEEILFNPAIFSLLSLKELIILYSSIIRRKDSSQRYLVRILEIASQTGVLERIFSRGDEVEVEDFHGPSLEEKEAVRWLRELILKKTKETGP